METKELPEKSVKASTTSNNTLAPGIILSGTKIQVKFK